MSAFSAALSQITFLSPWVLLGLAGLPALWFLLRTLPPRPRLIRFPAWRFLNDVPPTPKTAARMPWWLLLLRLLLAALVLLALSQPVLRQAAPLSGSGPVRIVLENSLFSAPFWPSMTREAARIARAADRAGRPVYLLTSAAQSRPGQDPAPYLSGPLSAPEVSAALETLSPRPWLPDYEAAAQSLERIPHGGESDVLSPPYPGGSAESFTRFLEKLQEQGDVKLVTPSAGRHDAGEAIILPPVLIRGVRIKREGGTGFEIDIGAERWNRFPESVSLRVYDHAGDVLAARPLIEAIDSGKPLSPALYRTGIDMPARFMRDAARIGITGVPGAGSVFLLDRRFRTYRTGYLSLEAESAPRDLDEPAHYIGSALAAFSDPLAGDYEALLSQDPPLQMIVLPDSGRLPDDVQARLTRWIEGGGVLVRFAGPKMAASEPVLVPVPVRTGGRFSEGAFSQGTPLAIAPIPSQSPLAALEGGKDVRVRNQILSDPLAGDDGPAQSWATLEDGTPLVTGRFSGQGSFILVHTTAGPGWSDLCLSGFYVEMLRRFAGLTAQEAQAIDKNHAAAAGLRPVQILDGYGRLQPPPADFLPVTPESAALIPGPKSPPGRYRDQNRSDDGADSALNAGKHISYPEKLERLPRGVTRLTPGDDREASLFAPLMLTALFLFLIDWIVTLWITRPATSVRAAGRLLSCLFFICVFLLFAPLARPAGAASLPPPEELAGEIYLAYVPSGRADLDNRTERGLNALAGLLAARTSVEPAGVVPVVPGRDPLSFFPLIYWPLDGRPDSDAPSSAARRAALRAYLAYGGMIFFDTRDASLQDSPVASAQVRELREITNGLGLPPLVRAPKDHVLFRSYYLLPGRVPGLYDGAPLWTAGKSDDAYPVSPVIIGAHDWAGAWALSAQGSQSADLILAERFGVNLVMYALTGNYKADQIHLPKILERLGR